MSGKREWRKTTAGIVRETGADGVVAVRMAWDGGIRVTVARYRDGIYWQTHTRRWGGPVSA